MPRVNLTGGAYAAKSYIAANQRQINLYPEINPESAQSPAQVTHYQTPGLILEVPGSGMPTRCVYRASNGDLYVVIGSIVSYVDASLNVTNIGAIGSGTSPVSMGDNGLVIILADGTPNGYAINMSTRFFSQIKDPNWYGSNAVAYLDTFLIFNRPGTNQFYISLSNATYQMFIGEVGPITAGFIAVPGSNYVNGTYMAVPLLNGSGNSATANITVSGGVVSSVTIVDGGTGYLVGDSVEVDAANLGGSGFIATGDISDAGSGYTDGTYTGVALTGGSGSGAGATIIISGGLITSVTITSGGLGYLTGDSLTAAAAGIGGTGSGFAYNVQSTTTIGSGFIYDISAVTGSAFDPLDIATKNSYPDNIVWIVVIQGYIWLVGSVTSEVWYNAGSADFTFARLPGVNTIEHGTSSPFSVVAQDLFPYWVKRDQQGKCMVLKGVNYQPKRISTFAIETMLNKLDAGDINNCVAYVYQQEGHTFIVFNFATITLVYDDSSDLWHQRCWTDMDGNLQRHRVQLVALSNGKIIAGDWENGNLYQLDLDTYTDNGSPISRIKTIPHIIDDNIRLFHENLMLDMSCGNDDGSIDGTSVANPPVVNMRYSDDRGKTYGSYLTQSLGAGGQYLTSPQYNRLGMARDRVYEISWSAPADVALQSVWLTTAKSSS